MSRHDEPAPPRAASESDTDEGPHMPSRPQRLTAAAALAAAALAALAARPAPAAEPSVYGGIEIGAKGIKVVAVPVDEKGVPDLAKKITKLPHKAVNNVTLSDLAADGSFRTDALAEAKAAVADFYKQLTGELKVPPENVWVVASSGLTVKGVPPNFDALRAAVSEATGGAKTLTQITQDQEVDLLIRGAIPKADWGDAIVIDVGTGNVKCGYHHPKRGLQVARNYIITAVIEGSGAYAKTIQSEVAKEGGRGFAAFCDAAARLRQTAVVDKVADQKNRMAGLENRSRVFLSGGVPWAIATLTNPVAVLKTDDLYVPLPVEALRKFRNDLRRTGEIPRPDLSTAPAAARAEAEQAVAEVADIFKKENLLAGAEVLLGFAEVLDWERQRKEVFFTQSGVVAWIVGFVDQEQARKPK